MANTGLYCIIKCCPT